MKTHIFNEFPFNAFLLVYPLLELKDIHNEKLVQRLIRKVDAQL